MATINIGNLAFTHKGDYASGTAYVKNDVVYYSTNGNAYIAKQSTTGNAPTNATYWNQFAQGSGGIWNAGLSLGSANQVVKVNAAGNALEFASDEGGTVVQLVQKWMNTTTTQSGGGYGTYYDVSGFTQTFTPQKASSKILVDLNATIGNSSDYGGMKVGANINSAGWNDIGMPDASGSRVRSWIGNHYSYSDANRTQTFNAKYLWTPTYTLGNSIDFKVMWGINNGATVVLNRSYSSTNSGAFYLGTSSLNLWEIN
tara:strand:- start:51 stop:821 length:771 start_codon:yes stop_codon:yes gene_type:complete